MTSLARLVEQFDPGEPFEAPAYWLQGGTVFNGLSAALSLQAILHRSAGAAAPQVRSGYFYKPCDTGADVQQPRVPTSPIGGFGNGGLHVWR